LVPFLLGDGDLPVRVIVHLDRRLLFGGFNSRGWWSWAMRCTSVAQRENNGEG
jgi:hypothetical protein